MITPTSCGYSPYPGEEKWVSAIPSIYRGITLQSCKNLPQTVLDYAVRWARDEERSSLYLYGTYGSGKTTFAFALLRQLMIDVSQTRYIWPRYMTGKELDNRLLQAFLGPGGDQNEIATLCDIDILFVDDFDKVNSTPRFKSQFFEIINGRLLSGKPTILTTNDEPEKCAELLDGSVMSRINDAERWQIIEFPKKDLRKSNVMKL